MTPEEKQKLREYYKQHRHVDLALQRQLEYNSLLQRKIVDSFDWRQIEVSEYDLPIPVHKFINNISSFPFRPKVGRQLNLLVRYRQPNVLLGHIRLSSPLIASAVWAWVQERAKTKEDIFAILNDQVVDLSVCVGIGEFTKYLSGKLMALIAMSQETIERYNAAYGAHIQVLFTTSIYGKSSLYNRLRNLEYLGETTGLTVSYSEENREEIKRKWEERHPGKPLPKLGKGGSESLALALSQLMREGVKFSFEPFEQRRGIYKCERFLPLADNMQYWYERWFVPRRERLKAAESARASTSPERSVYEESTLGMV